jgi:hypothetical protein
MKRVIWSANWHSDGVITVDRHEVVEKEKIYESVSQVWRRRFPKKDERGKPIPYDFTTVKAVALEGMRAKWGLLKNAIAELEATQETVEDG